MNKKDNVLHAHKNIKSRYPFWTKIKICWDFLTKKSQYVVIQVREENLLKMKGLPPELKKSIQDAGRDHDLKSIMSVNVETNLPKQDVIKLLSKLTGPVSEHLEDDTKSSMSNGPI